MIQYGTVKLNVLADSIIIIQTNNKLIRQYPGSDQSTSVDKGRGATKILMTLYARDEEERNLYMQIAHSAGTQTLTIDDHYYNNVEVGLTAPMHRGEAPHTWLFDVQFHALDPIPYSVASGSPVY
jgi:hypothetical protein